MSELISYSFDDMCASPQVLREYQENSVVFNAFESQIQSGKTSKSQLVVVGSTVLSPIKWLNTIANLASDEFTIRMT